MSWGSCASSGKSKDPSVGSTAVEVADEFHSLAIQEN
jgi:hypothetical protein